VWVSADKVLRPALTHEFDISSIRNSRFRYLFGSRQTVRRGSDIVLRMQQHTHMDPDIELDFIREFSVTGGLLNGLNFDDRRERIRVLIYTEHLLHKPFRDSGLDYGQAYERCYGRPIEMRVTPIRREPRPSVLAVAAMVLSE
jgi:hypothetical protein